MERNSSRAISSASSAYLRTPTSVDKTIDYKYSMIKRITTIRKNLRFHFLFTLYNVDFPGAIAYQATRD